MGVKPAKGSSVKLALKLETTYGVKPSGNFTLFPAISFNLGPEQDFLAADLLGQGRDAQIQDKDVPTRRGSSAVPIDGDYLGFWLTLLLGAPTDFTAGTPNTHEWTSGQDDLPSASVEVQHPDIDVPAYFLHTGVKLDALTFTMGGRGRVQADLTLTEKNMAPSETSGAGTAAVLPGSFSRFSPANGKAEIDLGGGYAVIGKALEVQFGWENNTEDQYYVGGLGEIGDVIPGVPALSGQVNVILNDLALVNAAVASTRFPMRITYSLASGKELILLVADAELASAQPQVGGAGGVQLPFRWVGGKTDTLPALTVQLKNSQASGVHTPA